jgi:hypothetical protein
MSYKPDVWLIVDTTECLKVFAGFYGGFTAGSSWKFSSGTEGMQDKGNYWELPQTSGSVYHLQKNLKGYGTSYHRDVLESILQVLPEGAGVVEPEVALEMINAGYGVTN